MANIKRTAVSTVQLGCQGHMYSMRAFHTSMRIAAICALACRRYGWLGKSRKSVASAPGVSPFTTICITDIEDSTNMWEEMEAQVVDTAVKLHNVCLRGLVAKHGGYESIWEGGSVMRMPTTCPCS